MENKCQVLVLIFTLFFFVPSYAAAPKGDYQAGYILTHQLDTVYGLIENREYDQNAIACPFLAEGSDSLAVYAPEEIFGYRFTDGKFYVSKVVDGKSYFLEYLVDGNLDVYFMRTTDNKDRYYVGRDTLPVQYLLYEDKEYFINDVRYLKTENLATNLLLAYTKDCPELLPRITNMGKPYHKNLIQLATEYQERTCPDQSCTFYEKTLRSRILLMVSGGVGLYNPAHFVDRSAATGMPGTSSLFPAFNVHLLLQQKWMSESTYLGIGYADVNRIPLGLYYIRQSNALTVFSGVEFDLNNLGATQNLILGLRKNLSKKMTLMVAANGNACIAGLTDELGPFFGGGLRAGLIFDLR